MGVGVGVAVIVIARWLLLGIPNGIACLRRNWSANFTWHSSSALQFQRRKKCGQPQIATLRLHSSSTPRKNRHFSSNQTKILALQFHVKKTPHFSSNGRRNLALWFHGTPECVTPIQCVPKTLNSGHGESSNGRVAVQPAVLA